MQTLEDFIVTVYCLLDDALRAVLGGRRLRRRGPPPALTDAEALTLLVVGECLGLDDDTTIWRYFRTHSHAWFPRLGDRTTFTRQAANLWAVAQALHTHFVRALGADGDALHLIDGLPVRACRLRRY